MSSPKLRFSRSSSVANRRTSFRGGICSHHAPQESVACRTKAYAAGSRRPSRVYIQGRRATNCIGSRKALRDCSGWLVLHGAGIPVRRDVCFLTGKASAPRLCSVWIFTDEKALSQADPPLQRTAVPSRQSNDDRTSSSWSTERTRGMAARAAVEVPVPTPRGFTDCPIEPRPSGVVPPLPYILADRTFEGSGQEL